jgi:hypothetical protein
MISLADMNKKGVQSSTMLQNRAEMPASDKDCRAPPARTASAQMGAFNSANIPASSITATPSSRALSSLLPASSPATT